MKTLLGPEGLIQDDLRFYFIEVIEYKKQTATRILVTKNEYNHLREYEPTIIGGPSYHDLNNNKFYYLDDIKCHDGLFKRDGNTLEIMNAIDHSDSFTNYLLNFSHCTSPRNDVKTLECCQWPYRYFFCQIR